MKKIILLSMCMLVLPFSSVLASNEENTQKTTIDQLKDKGINIPENSLLFRDDISETRKNIMREESKLINDYLNEMYDARAKARVIDNRLKDERDELMKSEIATLEAERNQLFNKFTNMSRNFSYNLGFEEVTTSSEDSTMSIADTHSGMVGKSVSKIYYSSDSNAYVAWGDFAWIDNQWMNDLPGTRYGYDIGGYDGFYIGIEEDIDPVSAYFRTTSNEGNSTNWSCDLCAGDRDWTPNGWHIKWQDSFEPYPSEYNTDSGYGHIYFTFDNSPLGENITSYMGYGHTWENTSISSISVGPYSGGFSWHNQGENWDDEVFENTQY
ncbi:hypothetical protein [Gracilibacillus sp. YIM 98692]|uniref:hypothetical protein n=1 Tax=Gracilibacillus sp. YIM 98692 TaxID=2663532 RepID=UPI0013D7700D|nr:hypothetical protein [Gracilibacillus sp. YIM 98692]